LLSGEVRLLKPDPRIFQLLLDNHAVDPAHTVYIDDLKPNVEAAIALGMHGILFTDPIALRHELVKVGLTPANSSDPGAVDQQNTKLQRCRLMPRIPR
jgi:2-haloacid dehalogenase